MIRPHHTVVVDLGYGDAGKGTIVDWLCATAQANSGQPVHTVIRYNGGAQAGHNVVTADGRHHTFSQFGAGTLQGVRTHLSRFMIVDPLSMAREADHLASIGVPDPWRSITIDRDALVSTPYHRAANQARERARGDGRHGSCGMGVGESAAYALAHPDLAPRVGDMHSPTVLMRKLHTLRDALAGELGDLDVPSVEDCMDAYSAFAGLAEIVDGTDDILRAGPCVFEGAQGVLLDEWRGFHPYTTWSTTTVDNATTLLGGEDAYRLGVVRTYTTRHGAGPLVTEDAGLTAAFPDAFNGTGPWQGAFRVGHFDAVAHNYAVRVSGGIDALAVTHADVTVGTGPWALCRAYHGMEDLVPGPWRDLAYQARLTAQVENARPILEPAPTDWPAAIGDLLALPVAVVSHGPTAKDKQGISTAAA